MFARRDPPTSGEEVSRSQRTGRRLLLKHDIAALEGQRSIARDEAGDRSPAVSARQPCGTGVLVSSDERLDVGGGEQGGIELSVSSDLVHPRSHQSDGRTDVAARRLDASAVAVDASR